MPKPIPTKIIGLDFETFFSKEYSLKSPKYTTTTYIRDPQFKVQCVGLQSVRAKTAKWVPDKKVKAALDKIDWSTTGLLCHHGHFDGLILSHHYGIVPAFYFCTLSMARPLHGGEVRADLDTISRFYGGRGKIDDYLTPTKGIRDLSRPLMTNLGNGCARDVEEMWRIFRLMHKHFPDSELRLIDETIRLYTEPMLVVDKELIREELEREQTRRAKAVDSVRKIIKKSFPQLDIKDDAVLKKTLRSRDSFAKLLMNNKCKPPTKMSEATGQPTYAFAQTDLEFQELSHHPLKPVRDLVEAKSVVSSTIAESKPARMLDHSNPRLTIYLAYGKAKTFRWTGGDSMNPQNFPRQSKLRNAMKAPKGYTLVIGDSSQIEDRTNLCVAEQKDVLQEYRDYDDGTGPDVYKIMASEIYQRPPDEISGGERFIGKVCRLQLGYQSGLDNFHYTLIAGIMGSPVNIEYAETRRAFEAYRRKNWKVVQLWSRMQSQLFVLSNSRVSTRIGPLEFVQGAVRLPNGMYVRYPRMRQEHDPNKKFSSGWVYNDKTHIYGGKLTENCIQALARIIVADQLMAAYDEMRGFAKMVLLVHDEGVFCVKNRYVDKAVRILNSHLRVPPSWMPQLPVNGKVVTSPFYLKD